MVSDVAFGDVWVCSGQSNMQWTVAGVRDAAAEIENALLYEDLRLLQVANVWSKVPVEEVIDFGTTWAKPSRDYLAGDSFSAICLFFGEQLVDELEVPIGLIDSSWGGTIVEVGVTCDVRCLPSWLSLPRPGHLRRCWTSAE